MSYQTLWTHRHVIHEARQTVSNFNNQVRVTRNYRQTVIAECPYGMTCPIAYPTFAPQNQIRFWPTPHPIPMVRQQLSPQFIPRPIQPRPPVWLSNDVIEFNTPASEFPNDMRIAPIPVELNRSWENIGHGNHLESYKTLKMTVLSYNVLSQILLESNQFVYNSCRREDLMWEARWEKIFNEVMTLNPDIFCLQEVQVSHLSYYARFQAVGYKGIFKKKTSFKADGCAVFYKCSMFDMIEYAAVEFRCEEIPFLRADSVAIMVKLAPRASPNTHLVVATTHLLYMPDENATRLAQMRILMNEIEKFSYDEVRGQLPFILSGDFNALPDSKVIKFLDEGQICVPVEESLESIGLSETDVDMSFVPDAVNGDTAANEQTYKLARHPFKLSSVYEINNGHGRWCTVDYVYFVEELTVVERLAPPTTCMRRKIPNEIYGSDHISIAAVFEMVIE